MSPLISGPGAMKPEARRHMGCLGLVLLVAMAYANSFPGAFIADDYSRVLHNPLVRDPDLRTIFLADYWGYGVNSGLHRPLTILSYAINGTLFGPGVLSFHAANVLLHAGVAVLLLLTAVSMGIPSRVAWWAAALFAVHPIHTEVVNIVTGRAELLAAGFLLLGWMVAQGMPSALRIAGTGLFYAAALLCKESAAAFPALLIAGDAFVTRDFRAQWSRRWPLYMLLAVVTAGWLAMRSWGLPFAHTPINRIYPLDNPLVGHPAWDRLPGIAKVQSIYLYKLILPFRLRALYTADTIGAPPGWPDPQTPFLLGVALLFAALLVHGWRKREWYGFGLAFYLIAFAVTSNVFRLTTFLMAERFAYLPSAGFCLAVAAAVASGEGKSRLAQLRTLAGVALLLLFWGLTVCRNMDFRDSTTLWSVEVKNAPGNARAWMFLGGAHEMGGHRREAEHAYRAAIRLAPDFVDASLSLGHLLLNDGRPGEARICFEEAYLRNPGASPLLSLALARATLALGDPRASLRWLEEVAPYEMQLPEYREVLQAASAALDGGGTGRSPAAGAPPRPGS